MRLAVASGSDTIKVEANLREIDLAPTAFAAIVTGSEVERKKPAPDIFIEACARLHLDPGECLVIEDAVNGVRAAKAAGTRCLALTTSFTAGDLTEADWIATDLAHVWHEPKVVEGRLVFFAFSEMRFRRLTIDLDTARVDDAPL